ncbi:hypothetical protein ACJX0J_001515, partial (mitochondrion) [Zea mays]
MNFNHTFCANGKEGDPDSLLPIEDYRIWLQAPVLLIMSRLEVICSKLLGKFLLGFHFHDLPKDILFFLILILVFLFDIEEELKPIIIGFYNELGTFELTQFAHAGGTNHLRHELVLGVEKQAKEPTLDRRFQLPIFALESNPEMGDQQHIFWTLYMEFTIFFRASFIFVGYSDQHKGSKSGEPCAKIPSFLSFLCFLVAVLKISAYINKELPERRTGQAKLLLQGLQPNNRTLFPTDELKATIMKRPGNTVSEEDPSRQALILPINVSVFILYCELLYQ